MQVVALCKTCWISHKGGGCVWCVDHQKTWFARSYSRTSVNYRLTSLIWSPNWNKTKKNSAVMQRQPPHGLHQVVPLKINGKCRFFTAGPDLRVSFLITNQSVWRSCRTIGVSETNKWWNEVKEQITVHFFFYHCQPSQRKVCRTVV